MFLVTSYENRKKIFLQKMSTILLFLYFELTT